MAATYSRAISQAKPNYTPHRPLTLAWLEPITPIRSVDTRRHAPRRRLYSSRSSTHVASQQCRSFATSSSRLGGRAAGHTSDRKRGKIEDRMQKQQMEEYQSQQPSIRVRMREMFLSDEVPEDLGLFPGTLITPLGSNAPGALTWKRWKMEWERTKHRLKDFFSVAMMKWQLGIFKFKINFRNTAPAAMALHRQVYSALADGDEAEIRNTTTEGVRDSLISQIQKRPKDVAFSWDLVKYTGTARVVSHRASEMPIIKTSDEDRNMLRQAVVRIKSVQRLVKEQELDEQADEATWEELVEIEKELVEYVVIQKRVLRGVDEPWKFWGTTEATKVEDFDETVKRQAVSSDATT